MLSHYLKLEENKDQLEFLSQAIKEEVLEFEREVETEKVIGFERKEVKKVEEKKNSENKKQLDAAIAKEILENGEKKWMVQVALAANQNVFTSIFSKE